MAITYPADCDTPEERWRYVESFLERFRRVHNVIGLWYREGITRDEYDNGVNGARIGMSPDLTITIPQRIKNQLPYQGQLSQARWDAFVAWHAGALGRLQGERITYLNLAKGDTTWEPNYDEL